MGFFIALMGPRLRAETTATPAELVELGRAIFFDANLSEPKGTSCASCHDPEQAFSGSHGSTIGVPRGSRPDHFARRTSPSLLYLKYVPAFRYYQEGDDPQLAPFGGLFWDGRVDTIRELARQPLLNPDEMNNPDGRSIARKIAVGSYAKAFVRAFGPGPRDPEITLASVGRALEAFLLSDEMAPFSSKYDEVVRGRDRLTAVEMQGLRLFQDPAKGGCFGCHAFSDTAKDPTSSMFTDYGYDAAAVPGNPKVREKRKPDLGLCERTDQTTPSADPMYCINFRTPSLRNVAVRGAFMHNGAFTRLRDAVAFYATRDTNPGRWYRSGVKFDDAPKKYRGQVNVTSPPYNRRAGDPPVLNDQEVDAIVAFMRTLTDARYRRIAQ